MPGMTITRLPSEGLETPSAAEWSGKTILENYTKLNFALKSGKVSTKGVGNIRLSWVSSRLMSWNNQQPTCRNGAYGTRHWQSNINIQDNIKNII